MKRIYTHKGYVLGARCRLGHRGNQRYHLVARASRWAQCQGCGHFTDSASIGFADRAAALAAEVSQ